MEPEVRRMLEKILKLPIRGKHPKTKEPILLPAFMETLGLDPTTQSKAIISILA